MIVVPKTEVTDSNLTSSIPEPDASVGEVEWTAGTYTIGQQVIKSSTHKLYQVVAASTTDDPEDGVLASPQTWVEVSATNKYRMFDNVIGTQATNALGSIVAEVTPNAIFNSVSAFNIAAQSVNVTVTDPVAGVVYDKDVSLRNNDAVVDYYEYFFEPIIERRQFSLYDLPAYPNASVELTFTSTDDVAVGDVVIGKQINLGVAQYGSSTNLLNFNTLERDDFGNFVRTTGRKTADRFDYDVKINSAKFLYVRNVLRDLNGIAAVWSGRTTENDDTIVFGYYRDIQINFESPSIYGASIQVEGLI